MYEKGDMVRIKHQMEVITGEIKDITEDEIGDMIQNKMHNNLYTIDTGNETIQVRQYDILGKL